MRSIQAAIRIKDALNKLDSKDYQNIPFEKIEEATNQAVTRFIRRRIPNKEANLEHVEDLQVLLKVEKLSVVDKGLFAQSHKLPKDYLGYSRNTVYCTKGKCKSAIKSDLVEDANVNTLLGDFGSLPSFDFEQTFHTIVGNRINQYHNKDFEVEEIELSYYRKPKYITYPDTYQFDGSRGKDMEWEFKEDICDLIITETVMILSGNIKDYQGAQYQAQVLNSTK